MRCMTLTKTGSGIGSGSNIISLTSCLMLQHRSIAPIDHYKVGRTWSRFVVDGGVDQWSKLGTHLWVASLSVTMWVHWILRDCVARHMHLCCIFFCECRKQLRWRGTKQWRPPEEDHSRYNIVESCPRILTSENWGSKKHHQRNELCYVWMMQVTRKEPTRESRMETRRPSRRSSLMPKHQTWLSRSMSSWGQRKAWHSRLCK
jgi:hypothetical protein